MTSSRGLLGYKDSTDLLKETGESVEGLMVGSEWSRFLGLMQRVRVHSESGEDFETDYLARRKGGSIVKVSCRSRLSISESRGEIFFATAHVV